MNLDDVDMERSWNNFKRIINDREFHIRKYDDHRIEIGEMEGGGFQHIIYQYKQFFRIWIDLGLLKEIPQDPIIVYPRFRIIADKP